MPRCCRGTTCRHPHRHWAPFCWLPRFSSIAGFAFSAICGVMLLHMMSDPLQVVETMMVCSIAIQSLSVAALWCDVEWRELLTFLAGGTIGLPFGIWLLLNLGHVGFREAVGALLKRPVTIRSGGNLVDACVGFLGGITGGLAGFPGATVTIWCGMRGWDKRRQRAIYQPFILLMQVLALLLIQIMRPSADIIFRWYRVYRWHCNADQRQTGKATIPPVHRY